MDQNESRNDLKPMSLMSLILSFLSLFVISGILFTKPGHFSRELLIAIDTIICALFLFQLSLDLLRASDRIKYLKAHWIDFLASIPLIEPLRYGRIFQILRVIRLIRSGRVLLLNIRQNRKEATIASILFLLVILLTLGSGLMILVERGEPAANIKSSGDALWWAFVTISTVGYGDHFPVTYMGKIVAAIMIICGVGIFGMISGLITSIITSPNKEASAQMPQHQLERLFQQQEQLLKQQNQSLQHQEQLAEKIAQLEKRIDQRDH